LAYRSLETGMDPYLPVYPCTKVSYKFWWSVPFITSRTSRR
jgi:hypothetical protein